MSDEKILRPSDASAFDGSSASQSVKQTQFADIADLKINPQTAMISAERVITTLPIRKPGSQEYFRVHPDSEYSETFLVIEDKADRETYVVHPSLQSEFAAEARPVQIVLGITRTYPFLWAWYTCYGARCYSRVR